MPTTGPPALFNKTTSPWLTFPNGAHRLTENLDSTVLLPSRTYPRKGSTNTARWIPHEGSPEPGAPRSSPHTPSSATARLISLNGFSQVAFMESIAILGGL